MEARSKSTAVRVTAPARLHLGFLDLNGGLGRRYGSIGLAIDRPVTDILLRPAQTTGASGAESDRVVRLLERYRRRLGIAGHHHAEVFEAIPAHAGLGSGTQLALALAAALTTLAAQTRDTSALARQAERGLRSAIGMAAFAEGGFLVDGGKGTCNAPPPLLVRMAFPETWRALLVLDPNAEGVHGERETEAFAALPPLPVAATAHVCRLVLMRLLPGLAEHDIAAFGAALSEIQSIVGGHFAVAQGGSPWTSPKVGRLIGRLAEAGAVGYGQSSWGPTGFAFVANESEAQKLYHRVADEAMDDGLHVLVVKGRNQGASVRVQPA